MSARFIRIYGNHLVIIFVLLAGMVHAQEKQIKNIDLFVENSILMTRIHLLNFFDDDTKESIASGLSRRFSVKFELVGPGKKSYVDRVEILSLKYDIWERIYILNAAGEEKHFDDFERFVDFFSDSTVFHLGRISWINQSEQLQLYIIFSQQEISERRRTELKSWISRDAETAESPPGLETNQSFSINISKLLSLFFSRESYSDLSVFKSHFFTLKSLSQNENSAK